MPKSQSSYPVSDSDDSNNLRNCRILIVDDQHDNLTLAGTVFELRGAVVELVDNARDALALLKDFEPSIILLDIAMPEIDGWELLKRIRALENTRHIPIVAVTVRVSVEDQQKALQAGFDGYVSKPYSVTGIVNQIQEILGAMQSRQP